MAYTLEDYLVAFDELKRQKEFSAGVQSTYLAILMEFQKRKFPPEIKLTVRALGTAAGLKSVDSVHEAKLVLKNHRLVDFESRKHVTAFRLCTEHIPNNNRTNLPKSTEQTPNNAGSVCYTPAQVQSGDGGSTLPLPPTPPIPIPKETESIPTNQPTASRSAVAESSKAEDVVKLWEKKTGRKLSDGEQDALRTFDEIYGREIIKVAIVTHVYKKGRTFSHFHEWCLKPLVAGLKGGEENGRDSQEIRMDRRAGGKRRDESTALGTSETVGKGRFDDKQEPDTGWVFAIKGDTSESEG